MLACREMNTQITAKNGEAESLKQEPFLDKEVLKSWKSSFLEDMRRGANVGYRFSN